MDEKAKHFENSVTDEDVLRIAAGCSLRCRYCIHSYGLSGEQVERALHPDYAIPKAYRITILAGDCLQAELAPLVERVRASGAHEVRIYAHPASNSEPLVPLKAAGLTGIYLVLPAASREALLRLAGPRASTYRTRMLIEKANSLGLGVYLEVPVLQENALFLVDTVLRALSLIARPEGLALRFLADFGPLDQCWDPAPFRESIARCLEEARNRGVTLVFAHPESPPPCVLDLESVTAENYPTLLSDLGSSKVRRRDMCDACKVQKVCHKGPSYLVAEGPVAGSASLDTAKTSVLFLRRAVLEPLFEEFRQRGPLCRYPWESLEAHDIRGTVVPCAGGWPLEAATNACASWREVGLLEAWNSPGMQAFRRAIASRKPEHTCKPECPAFHGGPQSALPPVAPPATRVFFENLVLNIREMLEGAEILRSRPLSLSISPTFRCPNHCRMCDIHEMREKMGKDPALYDMSDALFEEVRALLPTLRLLALTGGEPLVSRRLRTLLMDFRADRYPDGAVTLTTNGLLLRETLLKDLSRTRLLMVIVSLNAATEQTYEMITGTRGGFERVLRNVKLLLEHAPRMAGHPRVILSFVVMRSNLHEIPPFLDLAKDLGCGVRLLPVERNRCDESIFVDEERLMMALRFLETDVLPKASMFSHMVRHELTRLVSIIRSRLSRRVFGPL